MFELSTLKFAIFLSFTRKQKICQKWDQSTLLEFSKAEILKSESNIWEKVNKNRPIKICGRQPLKFLLGLFLNALSHLKSNTVNPRVHFF